MFLWYQQLCSVKRLRYTFCWFDPRSWWTYLKSCTDTMPSPDLSNTLNASFSSSTVVCCLEKRPSFNSRLQTPWISTRPRPGEGRTNMYNRQNSNIPYVAMYVWFAYSHYRASCRLRQSQRRECPRDVTIWHAACSNIDTLIASMSFSVHVHINNRHNQWAYVHHGDIDWIK